MWQILIDLWNFLILPLDFLLRLLSSQWGKIDLQDWIVPVLFTLLIISLDILVGEKIKAKIPFLFTLITVLIEQLIGKNIRAKIPWNYLILVSGFGISVALFWFLLQIGVNSGTFDNLYLQFQAWLDFQLSQMTY